jgi:hypothetical protein
LQAIEKRDLEPLVFLVRRKTHCWGPALPEDLNDLPLPESERVKGASTDPGHTLTDVPILGSGNL